MAAEKHTSANLGEQFGQRRPPLSVTIRQILGRYPDGQIFKEMIQNADDAGASIVQFYVDCRQHGSQGLVKPELASYQGPALVSANDAEFSKEDWEGLQSLQQSTKADDPFKVGHFGIGFNSVYHLTDLPSIISGNKIVFLDPQEQVWKGESGRSFTLRNLLDSDHLTPLQGISGFSSSMEHYPKTLFRFPLRTTASGISDNVYTVQSVNELIDALRSEAKLLLLFLRSVHTIEVYNIDNDGGSTLSLQISIAGDSVQTFKQQRGSFHRVVKSCHTSQQYNFSNVISTTFKFDVCVYDESTGESTTNRWFVANRVDSTNATVRAASVSQKVFPWVGTAVELDNPGNGRTFCFLPVPVENTSDLPVHVNGMFGLTDDRRSLKWPTDERRNDPMADWNQMLVEHVIPSCYIDLLLEAKLHFNDWDFYRAWPDNKHISQSWKAVLKPVFRDLFNHNVILTESASWVSPSTAVYVPKSGQQIPPVVKAALTDCYVKLAEVPETVWNAFNFTTRSVTEITPTFLLEKLRLFPDSYDSYSHSDKVGLLEYCLSDEVLPSLINIQLLPLANGSFISFQVNLDPVYVCTKECPKEILPNLGHRLVNQPNLQAKLVQVGESKKTQLRVLNVSAVSELLAEAMPSSWKNATSVTFPHGPFHSEWLSTFWMWLKDKELSVFGENHILPVHHSTVPVTEKFSVLKLRSSQPVFYSPHNEDDDTTLFSILNKFDIRYCTKKSFEYVEHQALKHTEDLFKLIGMKQNYASVELSLEEAKYLRRAAINQLWDLDILRGLKIFSSCVNTDYQLYSINDTSQQVIIDTRAKAKARARTSTVIVEPESHSFDLSLLPSNIIIFSSLDRDQKELLDKLGYKSFDTIDEILTRVLDVYDNAANSKWTVFESLPFVKVASGVRKAPTELCDPHDALLSKILFREKDTLFPVAPYDAPKYISILKRCGLRNKVTPTKILEVIYSISLPASCSPQPVNKTEMLCALAILECLTSSRFEGEIADTYRLDPTISGTPVPFPKALMLLSSQRSWLPVLAKRPSNYLPIFSWKGKRYPSHFVSLGSSVYVYSSDSFLSLVYGSQAYFTHPCNHLKNNIKKPYYIMYMLCGLIVSIFLFFIFSGS